MNLNSFFTCKYHQYNTMFCPIKEYCQSKTFLISNWPWKSYPCLHYIASGQLLCTVFRFQQKGCLLSQVLGHGFGWTKFGLHVQAWKPHVQFGVLLSKGTQFPRSLSITQRCENRQETQVSTTIGHPEPGDLWGHRANIRHVLPLFTLFSHPGLSTLAPHEPSPRAKGFAAFLLHRSRLSSLASPAHLFSSHPTLHGGELQLPAHLTKETSSQHKLYHPLSCNSTFSRRTSTSQKPTETSKTVSHNFERHSSNSFFHFSRTVKHLGLMIY